MSGYNDGTSSGQAGNASGQNLTIGPLPGGLTLTFNIRRTGLAVGNGGNAFPTFTGSATFGQAAFGNTAYTSTPGRPALYQGTSLAATANPTTFTLSNITLRDSANNTLTGYRIAIGDAERNDSGESLAFSTSSPANAISLLPGTACAGTLSGTDASTNRTCTGGGSQTATQRPFVVETTAPTTITATLTPEQILFGRSGQGVAFALVSSRLELVKSVVGRVNTTDSFDLSITSPEGTQVGAASTGPAPTNSGTTGAITAMPGVTSTRTYTLSEAPTPNTSTDLSVYTKSWSCTNGVTASNVTSVDIAPSAGDVITCTVTNTAPPPPTPPSLRLVKEANVTSVSAEGDPITYTYRVTNTGDANVTGVTVTDTQSNHVPISVPCSNPNPLPPHQTATCTSPYSVTAQDAAAGAVIDTATASGNSGSATSNEFSVEVDVRPTPQPAFTSIVVNTTNTLELRPTPTITFTTSNCVTPTAAPTTASCTFRVPAGVTQLMVSAIGAGGGNGGNGNSTLTSALQAGGTGGGGAMIGGTIPVTPGETLVVNVGARGQDGGSGTAGGTAGASFKAAGNGAAGSVTGSLAGGHGGGGGGASSICPAQTLLCGVDQGSIPPLVVAAGGGGGGGAGGRNGGTTTPNAPGVSGGAGGTANGTGGTATLGSNITGISAAGGGACCTAQIGGGGEGFGNSAGGGAGPGSGYNGSFGTATFFGNGNGGAGGAAGGTTGTGGFSGGGGGAGGGASWLNGAVVSPSAPFNTGNGSVTITFVGLP